jgi:hypothetical protein
MGAIVTRKRTTLRAERTSGDTTEHYFDCVLKTAVKSRPPIPPPERELSRTASGNGFHAELAAPEGLGTAGAFTRRRRAL